MKTSSSSLSSLGAVRANYSGCGTPSLSDLDTLTTLIHLS